MLKRVLSALVGIPILLLAVWEGHIGLFIITALIMILGNFELNALFKKMQFNPSLVLSVTGSLLFLISAWFNKGIGYSELIITFIVMSSLVLMVLMYPRYKVADIIATLFGIFYVGWLSVHFYLIRQVDKGFYFMLLMLVATWATDTFAYFVGSSLGRHKIAPLISPKKSVEGSLGGVIGAILVALLFAVVKSETAIIHYVIIGLLIGVISQLGDLAESVLKRAAQIKDSGNLIPGHGGVLDRFDSLLFTAPLVYYYLKLFIIS